MDNKNEDKYIIIYYKKCFKKLRLLGGKNNYIIEIFKNY